MDSLKAAYTGGTLLTVLKVSERCNIACDYCYFFFAGDESYQQHPALVKQNTLEDLVLFFQKGIAEFNLSQIRIILHGGEPMLMGKERFDAMCSLFSERLAEQVTLLLSMQTNAMLVDEEWIALFDKHQVAIGVSLDGPREINDRHRIDKRGRGTYDRTVQGIRCLQAAIVDDRLSPIGLLCVVDPANSASELYQHFVHDLGFETMDFMLPDINYETAPENLSGYQDFMLELFDAWLHDNNPKVNIRFFNKILNALGQREVGRLRLNNLQSKRPIVLTISSGG
ncbi:MAG: radical SAM protein, partial [Betaproteobacteria bacterium]|nr:radical SAM protein [Betaproteobacteria bacterium]